MTARDHNKLLAIFFFVQGGLSLLGGLIITVVYGGMGAVLLSSAPDPEGRTVGGVFLVLGVVIGVFVLAIAGFILLTGWKVLNIQSSGRTLGIIASILSLLSFPLGTALGIYGLWFFFGDDGKALYQGGPMVMNQPPPTPQGWQ